MSIANLFTELERLHKARADLEAEVARLRAENDQLKAELEKARRLESARRAARMAGVRL